MERWQEFASRKGDDEWSQAIRAEGHFRVGLLWQKLGQRDEARKEYETARDLRKKLADAYPAVPENHTNLGGSYCNFGNLILDEGKPADSLHWFGLAIPTLTPVYEKEPRDFMAKLFLRNSHWSRAVVYYQLKKHAEAVKDWDKAIELSPGLEQLAFRASRATSRLQAGQVAEAIAEVAEMTTKSEADTSGSPKWTAGQWYDFACVYAVASGKIADKKQEYADRAMELLYQGVKAGFKNAAHMAKDTDLDPLRGREDFKKLLADLNTRKEADMKP